MSTPNPLPFMQENRWVIIALVFFVTLKFILVFTIWHDRILPPEPDDSYTYIAHIASVRDCGSFVFCAYPWASLGDTSGFAYLSYRIFFGSLGKIAHLISEQVYYLSFYLGTLFLACCLPFFLRTFTNKKALIAWSIFFLAFYHGLGETHGFFWVVPSFFSMVLFFIISAYILRENSLLRFWHVSLLTVLYYFSHPTSLYFIAIPFIYLFFHFFFTRTLDLAAWKKLAGIISILLLAYSFQMYILWTNNNPNSYGIGRSVTEVTSLVSDVVSLKIQERAPESYTITSQITQTFISQKLHTLQAAYFRWLFPHWFFVIPFVIALFLCIYKKEWPLLSFYMASFFFFVIATILHPFGYRAAVVLWPVTYIMFAFASWHFFQFLLDTNNIFLKRILSCFTIMGIGAFFFLNALFAYSLNSSINARHDFAIGENIERFLLEETKGQTIALPPEINNGPLGNSLFLRKQLISAHNSPEYLVLVQWDKIPLEENYFHSVLRKIGRKLGFVISPPVHPTNTPLPASYKPLLEEGAIILYQKNDL